MTEESYQQGRKFMQKVNYVRGLITVAKGNVAKWGNIEDSFRKNLQESRADGAKKMLDKAMEKLKAVKDKFAALKFPDSDIVKGESRCKECGKKVPDGKEYCGLGICENEF